LTITGAAQFLGLGAKYIVYKFQDLVEAIERQIRDLREEAQLRLGLLHLSRKHGLIGKNPAWIKVLMQVERFAPSREHPVLLFGASGTGKELVARMTHELSKKSDTSRFVAVNCATIRGDLVRSQLFGHTKGSFTGAIADHRGVFEEADGGTILLDEIQALDALTQAMLLRAIQEKKITPVGSNQEKNISNVRLVVACNQPLEKLIEIGQFREDLFHRLNVLTISLPTLAERREDITDLAQYFLSQFFRGSDASNISFSAEVLQALEMFPWPGNVRELENTIIRTLVARRHKIQELQLSDLPHSFLRKLGRVDPNSFVPTSSPTIHKEKGVESEVISSNEPFILRELTSLTESYARLERWSIIRALRMTAGNQSHAAKILDITRGKLRDRMQAFGVGVAVNVQS
jgi:DNA-binding NtrC family response regulator